MEVEFLSQYDKNLKKYTEACQLPTDLSMDAAPPKSRCVQVMFNTLLPSHRTGIVLEQFPACHFMVHAVLPLPWTSLCMLTCQVK